jgi:hypothetical protein
VQKQDFVLAIPVLNQHDITHKCVGTFLDTAKSVVKVVFVDNGSDEPLANHAFIDQWRNDGHTIDIIRNDENIGVYPTFQQVHDHVSALVPWIFYSHNDVRMLEFGWDAKLRQLLHDLIDHSHNPGVCGMFGAKGIGTYDIYKAPYDFTQMMRWSCYTVPSMAGAGGQAINGDWKRIMVLDGFALIIRREMVQKAMAGRFDHDSYPVHHMYDNDICLMSHYGGYKNFVLEIDCKHLGGHTSTREKWAEKMDTTDLKIHRAAHVVFYKKWKGRLPVSVH